MEKTKMWKTASGNIFISLEVDELDLNPDFDLDFAMEELKKGRMSLGLSISREEFNKLLKDLN